MKRARLGFISCSVLCAFLGAISGCNDEEPVVDAGVVPDAAPEIGTLSLDWTVENGPDTLACDQVGGLNVRVTATPQDGGFGTTDTFNCDTGAGTSAPFKAGVYNIEVALITNGNQPLTTPEVLQTVEVVTGQDTSLGSFVFQVVPTGNVDFTIDAQNALGNCVPEADGGAGITGFVIEFRDQLGECIPSTLVIGDGANQMGGTYASNCQGVQYGCIDLDQAVRAQDVPAGQGQLSIVGYRGADECYSRNPAFPVSGNGLVTELSPQALSPVGVCVPPAP